MIMDKNIQGDLRTVREALEYILQADLNGLNGVKGEAAEALNAISRLASSIPGKVDLSILKKEINPAWGTTKVLIEQEWNAALDAAQKLIDGERNNG